MGPIEYNKRLSFGTISTTTNPNTGGPVRAFVPKFTVWGQIRRRTMANNYSVIANGLTDTPVSYTHLTLPTNREV